MAQDTPPLDPQQTGQTREHQLRFVVNVLARRWLMILLISFFGSVCLGIYGLLKYERPQGTYTAQAKVLVTQSLWDRDVLKSVGGAPLFPVDAQSLVRRSSNQRLAEKVARALIQQAVAQSLPAAALATEEEYAAKAAEIKGMLNIAVEDPQSGVILIEARNCPSRDEAARVAEFAARIFVEDNRQLQVEEEQETHETIRARLQQVQEELSKAETAEWQYKEKMGFETYDELAGIYRELKDKKADQEKINAQLSEIAAQLTDIRAQLPEALGNVNDNVVTQMITELNDLLKEQLNLSVDYTPEYPGLQELQDEINAKLEAIREGISKVDGSVGDGADIWNRRQYLYQRQLDQRLSLAEIDMRIATLKRALEDLIPKIPELANKNLELERLANDTQHIRDQFNKLREKEFEIRTALNRENGQVERHESVYASPVPVGGGRIVVWMNFVLGGLIGFGAGLALAMMFEMMDTSVKNIEDINNYIGLEVIGTIPYMRFGKGKGRGRRGTYVAVSNESQIDECIVTQHDPKSPVSEAYRTLRTNFQFATIKQKPKTIMVTSAVPGEGKTTTAVNMAVTMADCGIRVLLVDTDLRRPNVHRVLKMGRGPGLADVLRGNAELSSVIRKTSVENMWVISSGRVPPNPSELIGSAKMQRLMDELSGQFGLVVCDAPSILVVTDPVLLATHVDTAVLVVSVNNARRETIQRAHKLLDAASVQIAGVVLNGLEATRRHYYYYYYYYEDGGAGIWRRWARY
ncbi:MAG: polysaccharide biosynthesis tyrosine autokinase [Candidatus Hydrogenedentes bacterium]|nr:polysaccharide biosynthesis tyrosine autokinase [Candidatus Hydrogenedentota bacterium]